MTPEIPASMVKRYDVR